MKRFSKIAVWMRRIFILATVTLSPQLLAWCETDSTTATVSFPPILIQQDIPVGSILSSTTLDYQIRCDNEGLEPEESFWIYQINPTSMNNSGRSTLEGVIPTGYSGIGLRWTKNGAGNRGATTKTITSLNASSSSYIELSSSVDGRSSSFSDLFELVKTGDIAADGQLQIDPISAYIRSNLENTIQNNGAAIRTVVFSPFAVNIASCSLRENSITVNMGQLLDKNFRGMRSTSERVPFNIDLECVKGTKINMQFDNSNALSAIPGAIRLSEVASAAKGVVIQILSNGSPITLGEGHFVAQTTTSDLHSMQYEAQFVQVERMVRGGRAQATLNFTVSYH